MLFPLLIDLIESDFLDDSLQLFGLVNTLLGNSRLTAEKDLSIQRYAVIPLSPNSGLIGWVPNCDTLHHLIREYRDARKVCKRCHDLLLSHVSEIYIVFVWSKYVVLLGDITALCFVPVICLNLIPTFLNIMQIPVNVEHRTMLAFAPDYERLTLMAKVEVFEHALDNSLGNDLAKVS